MSDSIRLYIGITSLVELICFLNVHSSTTGLVWKQSERSTKCELTGRPAFCLAIAGLGASCSAPRHFPPTSLDRGSRFRTGSSDHASIDKGQLERRLWRHSSGDQSPNQQPPSCAHAIQDGSQPWEHPHSRRLGIAFPRGESSSPYRLVSPEI